ncbi:alpha-(1-_3)-arabinofuranosyltransferase family protein, partial [Corynebacterium glyciniphilum]
MTLSRRGWSLAGLLWLLLALIQGPGLTVADTKHDLTANPWGFLTQALSPWTDVFPLGQLQNQAYGYLFPQGLFFALLDPLPDWLTQRLWWALLLFLAFAGVVRLLEATGTGSRLSRLVAAVLFALSP